MSLKIEPMKTAKNDIKQRKNMKNGIIMRHPSISIFVGSIGSGKSTLVTNLLSKSNMLGIDKTGKPYFDHIFVMTGSDDDLYENLIEMGILDEKKITIDPNPDHIGELIQAQRKDISKKGIAKSDKVLIILDDVVDDQKMMKSKNLRSLFIKPRQLNISVFLLSQYLNLIPKFMRNNAQNIFFFRGNRSDHEQLCEQFCPSSFHKKDFLKLIHQATEDRDDETHNFLHINRKMPLSKRFRRNLDKVIKVE